jgi:hypothetical protein
MATIEFTGDGVLNFYGTNVLNDCVKFSSGATAEQLLGLVPCLKNDDTLCTKSCFTVPVFDGDFNSFLFEFSPSVINADFRLFKQNANSDFVQVAILSSAEGTPFDLGFNSNYPNYAGFQLDWNKIINLYGQGYYQFVVNDSVNVDDSLFSYPFWLRENTCDSIDGTVYLEVTNIGEYRNWKYTKDNGLLLDYDLINLEWVDSCRYYGKVVNTDLEQNIEIIKYANGRGEPFYNTGVQNYDCNLFKIDYELFKRIEHYLKGKDVKVTNDNLDREYTLIKQNVRQVGEATSNKFAKNKLLYQVQIKLKDEFEDKYKSC